MAESKPRVVLQFIEYDFRHRKVLEILRAQKRHMSDLVVTAVLHYVSCPEAETEFSKETVRNVVKEVIAEMLADGTLTDALNGTTSASLKGHEESFDFGDMMSAFRK